MYNIAVLGHQEITKLFVATILKERADSLSIKLGLCLSPNSAQAADYIDMLELYSQNNIPFSYINDYTLKDGSIDTLLTTKNLDAIFVVGWSRLIPDRLVSKYNFLGWHGGAYPPPRCRGRAGVNWAIMNRHNSFHYYVMKLDSGVDSGAILAQDSLYIEPQDTVRTIYIKLGFNLVELFVASIANENHNSLYDSHFITPTILPGRRPNDSEINWLQSDKDIDAFVRALSSPYPNAYSIINGKDKLYIKSGRAIGVIPGLNLQPGEIYADTAWGGLLVGCSYGNYFVEDYEFFADQFVLHGKTADLPSNYINKTISY